MVPELVGYADAEFITGLSRGSLRSRVHRKSIPHVRISRRTVRFKRSELEAWMTACSVGSVSPSRSTNNA